MSANWNTLQIQYGKVLAVDSKNWTCTVGFDDSPPLSDLPVSPMYLGPKGNGVFYLPEVGAMVLVGALKASQGYSGNTPFVLCGHAFPFERPPEENESEEDYEINEGEDTSAPNYSAYRFSVNAGDIVLSSREGGHVILRSGGVVEIGSSAVCRRFYIPITNMIREITSAYHMTSASGEMSFTQRRGELGWGNTSTSIVKVPGAPAEAVSFPNTPTEFKLTVNEFAQDADPIITLQMGRIESIDGSVPIDPADPSGGLVGGFADSDVVAHLNINDRFNCWIDKQGVINTKTGSAFHESIGNYTQVISGKHTILCEGDAVKRWAQRHTKITHGSDTLEVAKGVHHSYGSMDRTIKGHKTDSVVGVRSYSSGAYLHDVGGRMEQDVDGQVVISAGGDMELSSTVGNFTVTAGGAIEMSALNTSGNSGKAINIDAAVGSIQVSATVGNIILDVGTPVATAKVVVSLTGKITLSTIMGHKIVIGHTGIGIHGPMGQPISIDNFGKISLGAAPLGGGCVVTTATHPVCYVTGAPIKGSNSVGAPGTPLSGVGVGPTFIHTYLGT